MKKEKRYEISDGERGSLLDDYPIEEANNGKEAIHKYLAKTGREYNIRRSKDNDVVFKAQAFYEKDGIKYKDGNSIWYKIIFQ